MSIRRAANAVTAALLVLFAACGGGSGSNPADSGGAPEPTARPREPNEDVIDDWECPFDAPVGADIECGRLSVPEVRPAGDDRTIEVPFALLKTRSRQPLPDPIVYLAGGPAQNILDDLPFVYNTWFLPFQAHRDIVVFDIRGAGYSEPWLDCYEPYELSYDGIEDGDDAAFAQADAEALGDCSARLRDEDGVNVSAYNSAEAAADVHDLMVALGYAEWNLYGVSYGTRLALTIMRDYPEGVRSVVLDSAFPPEVDFYGGGPGGLKRALDEFFSECEADDYCGENYPGLESRFYETVEELDSAPADIPVHDPYTGEPTGDEVMDGSRFIGLVDIALSSEFTIPSVPDLIADTADGEYGLAASMIEDSYAQGGSSTDGTYWSVQCAEEVPFSSRDALEASVAAHPEIATYYEYDLAFYYQVCDLWGSEPPDALENEPVVSDIPTLVLAGQYDPITPPEWGENAAEKLENSFFYVYPHLGHAVSVAHSCPFEMSYAFFEDPLSEPDDACIEDMPSPF